MYAPKIQHPAVPANAEMRPVTFFGEKGISFYTPDGTLFASFSRSELSEDIDMAWVDKNYPLIDVLTALVDYIDAQ